MDSVVCRVFYVFEATNKGCLLFCYLLKCFFLCLFCLFLAEHNNVLTVVSQDDETCETFSKLKPQALGLDKNSASVI